MRNDDEGCVVSGPSNVPSWNLATRRELVDLYLRQMSIASLAEHFEVSSREIVRELSKLFLGVTDPWENKFVERFGEKWDLEEEERLHILFRRGNSVESISRELKRDRLGVCFRILQRFDVVIPQQTIDALRLEDYWENESDPDLKSPKARTCGVCLDVIVYCKCRFQDWEDPR